MADLPLGRDGAVQRGARGGSVYGLLMGMQRALPLILLPLYATVLAPEDYGQIAILVAVTAVLGILFSLGLEAAVLRLVVQTTDPRERYRLVNTLGVLALAGPLAGAIMAAVVTTGIGGPLGVLESGAMVLLLALLGTAVQTTGTVFVGAVLRADERLRDFSIMVLSQSAVTTALTITLVVALRQGPLGWFLGALGGSLVGLGIGLALLGHKWSRELSFRHLRAALVFGVPLLPHMLSHWVLNLSDRVVLGGFGGAAEVGVYNVAYQLAAGIGLIAIAMHQGVMPVYAAAATSAELRRGLSRFATYQIHVTLVLGLAVALLGPSVITFVFPGAYAAAGPLIPWIAIGFVMFGLYLVPVDSISLLIGQTRWLWVPTTVAATSNLVLNLVFIPRFGAMAAAVNTAIAYALLLGGVLVYRRRLAGPRVEYETLPVIAGLAVVVMAWLGALVVSPEPSEIAGVAVRALIVAGAGVGLLFVHRRLSRATHDAGAVTGSSSSDRPNDHNVALGVFRD